MWINRPVRITGSFFSAMRRRMVFGEQFRALANSSTVMRRAASGAGFFVLFIRLDPRRRSAASDPPAPPRKRKDCRVRAGLVRGAVPARRRGHKSRLRAGLLPGWLGTLSVMAIRSRHADDMPCANWP